MRHFTSSYTSAIQWRWPMTSAVPPHTLTCSAPQRPGRGWTLAHHKESVRDQRTVAVGGDLYVCGGADDQRKNDDDWRDAVFL